MNTLKKELLVSEHDVRHLRICRISKEGKILWTHSVDWPLDLQLLKNGGCLINAGREIIELDSEQNEVWRYSVKKGEELVSCRRIENGNTIIGNLHTQSIFEITPSLQKVWEMPFPYDGVEDIHTLFRMFRLLKNGNLIIAWHGKSKVAEFTKAGECIWEFDLEAGPYEALELENGNFLVSVGPAGSVVEISKEKGIVWEFRTDTYPGLEKGWIAGMSIQPNGNIIICDSKNDKLIEVNREKEVVGIFHDPEVVLHPSTAIVL